MAVTKVPTGAALKLKLNTGTDGSGNPVFRSKSLSNVKPTTADSDIYDVAVSLSGLQSYTLASISRVDSAELINA
ncbi:MAG: hypothetical protein A4E53_00884 [Pelotomaculum sp. PtaB.Bin104]|nr:MAG: hypothetical protein A4E53_00884 [Pelotomaculum sp. PtaB.Bin104]